MELGPLPLVLLALIGLAGGIGITAVGPGGVLPTIGMLLVTGLPHSSVAGTAIVTHVATGVLGTAVYTRSGQLRDAATRRIAAILAVTAVAGTPLGVLSNTMVNGRGFGALLALAIVVAGGLVWVREHRAVPGDEGRVRLPPVATAVVGLMVAIAAGLFGLGGPMLSVPLLVICGVPVLPALAAAQAQSVVIAGVGTLGYLLHGSIVWPIAALVGVPELAGVLIGWKIAHLVPARRLKYALVGTLLLLAPFLAFHT
jgi:uncharacterized membrane protein YfcA